MQAKNPVVVESIAPHDAVHDVVEPPVSTQFVQQRQGLSAAHALTSEQHFVFVHEVQGGSLAVGVQSTPPELDDDALTPLHVAEQCAATHALSACVVASGCGHCFRHVL